MGQTPSYPGYPSAQPSYPSYPAAVSNQYPAGVPSYPAQTQQAYYPAPNPSYPLYSGQQQVGGYPGVGIPPSGPQFSAPPGNYSSTVPAAPSITSNYQQPVMEQVCNAI